MESNDTARHHFAYCSLHGYKPFVLCCPKCNECFCKDCIEEAKSGPFCNECNTSLVPVSQLPSLRQKSIAIALALLFGFLGFHHFYTGETGAGITHLLLSIVAAVLLWFLPEVSYCYYIIMTIICTCQAASYGKAYDKWGRPFV